METIAEEEGGICQPPAPTKPIHDIRDTQAKAIALEISPPSKLSTIQEKPKEPLKQGLVLDISPPPNPVRKVTSAPASRPKNEFLQRRSLMTSGATNTRPAPNTMGAVKPLNVDKRKSVLITSSVAESPKSRAMPPPLKSESVRPKNLTVKPSSKLEATPAEPLAEETLFFVPLTSSAEVDEQTKEDVKKPLASARRLVVIVFIDALLLSTLKRARCLRIMVEIKVSEKLSDFDTLSFDSPPNF